MIREYKSIDKNAVLELIRLNIPKYFQIMIDNI